MGSIPSGYLLVKVWTGKDIRQLGSGNVGATNVYRVVGLIPGTIVLVLDIVKGWLPVWLAETKTSFSSVALVGIGLTTVIGHTFSCWLKGRGGKGVATSFGVILGLFPAAAISCFLFWLVVLLLTRYVSLASMIAALFLPVTVQLFQQDMVLTAFATAVTVVILWRHRENIRRLLSRSEHIFLFPWEQE